MTDRLYFDNAATSFPKPPEVVEAMVRYASDVGVSPGRGGYAEAIEAGRIVDRCRQRLCRLFGGERPEHVIFTLNATDAINLAVKGIARHAGRGGGPVHLVTTDMDHNSVLRPHRALAAEGVEVTWVTADAASGLVDPADVAKAIRPETCLVSVVHASNVTGVLQPAPAIGRLCRERGVPFLLDAAQTLGHVPLDIDDVCADLLAFPGHKGLLGPLGTGGLYIRPGIETRLDPLREGGTGSASEQDVQPDFLPDRYEPGSPNGIGLAGLDAGVAWILERGIDTIWTHERELMTAMLTGLEGAPAVTLLGPRSIEGRCGVFSITVDGMDPAEGAAILEEAYGILVRPGLHCAPRAHRTIGSEAGGTIRLSLGHFHTVADVERATDAVRRLAAEFAGARS